VFVKGPGKGFNQLMAIGEELRQAAGAADEPMWRVMRLDDNGNHFEIAHDLTQPAAQEMARQFEESGHKHFYWILPTANGD
jgi:hypothetical protein